MISVAIPAHNESKYILPCLKTLTKQDTTENFEVVVCLNNCTDDTEQVINDFASNNKINIRTVVEERKGVTFARDTATRACEGEIILNTDADSEPFTNWLSEARKSFEKNPKAISAYGPIEFPKEAKWWQKWLAKYGYTWFLRITHLFGVYNFGGFNFVVKREAYLKVDGLNLELKTAEDVDLAMRLKKIGKVVFNAKMKVYTSHRRLENNPGQFFAHHIKNFWRVVILKKEALPMKDIR
ncbi:MAG: glycosyltransferase family A protein [bacterium]